MFSMQRGHREQMIQKVIISKKVGKNCFWISIFQIVSHLSSLNYNTSLACFDFSLFHFIPYTPPVFSDECSHCWIYFNWTLMSLEPLICSRALHSVFHIAFN